MDKENINIEIDKLEKLRSTINLSLNTLNRDRGKVQTLILILEKELKQLRVHLKNLRSKRLPVISLTDYKYVLEKINEVEEKINYQNKQLGAIIGFINISKADLQRCESDLAKFTAIKTYQAEIIPFQSHE